MILGDASLLPTLQMQAIDGQIRSQLQQARGQAGAGSTVTANVTYGIGPDGQRYATGGTVTTSSRDAVSANGQAPGVADAPRRPLTADNETTNAARFREPVTLQDIAQARLSLSPLEFAEAFSEEFNDDIRRSQLQVIDAGVRSQESLHFRAAGGLATGVPQYGYQVGPDGELYATSGQVNIGSSSTTDERKAARDATTLGIAATAPGDASPQDIAVARDAFSRAASLYQRQFDGGLAESGERFSVAA